MQCEHNPKIDCTCPVDCENHGKCCVCVAHHREVGAPPNCFTIAKKD